MTARDPTVITRRRSSAAVKAALCLAGLLIGFGLPAQAGAQAQQAPTPPADASAPAAQPAAKPFSQAEIRKLVAPIALYSDSLLAQVLPATAYPVDIVSASRWLAANQAAAAKGDFSKADGEDWDPSVKALLRFPTVIERLNADIGQTQDLGEAFVAQPEDVAAAIQALRREAQAAGSLKSSKQQVVATERQGSSDVVVIRDAEPGVVYVPTYDPVTVYESNDAAVALLSFGLGIATAAIISDNYWNWNSGWVYPPRWAGYPGYRPIAGRPIVGHHNNIGINNGWRPDANRFRPSPRVQPALGNRFGGPARAGTLPKTGLGDRPQVNPTAKGKGQRVQNKAGTPRKGAKAGPAKGGARKAGGPRPKAGPGVNRGGPRHHAGPGPGFNRGGMHRGGRQMGGHHRRPMPRGGRGGGGRGGGGRRR